MSAFEQKQTETNTGTAEVPQVASENGDSFDESQKLSTIRNILLGGQIEQYDSKFTDLEKRFEEIKNNLFEKTQNKLSNLDNKIQNAFGSFTQTLTDQVKKEFEVYTEKLDAEKNDRYSSLEKFVSRLDKFENECNGKFSEIQTQIQNIENSLAQKIGEQIQVIKEDIQSEFDKLSEAVKSKVDQQVKSKIERTELVSFFKDMADRFSL